MSREIKFRAWDPHAKCMMEDTRSILVRLDGTLELEWSPDKLATSGSPNLLLMQFTGLQDKTGKDIYEGDVFDSGQKRGSDKSAILYKVHWDDEGACWGFKQLGGFCLTGGLDKDKIVVIGNIHENPELLKA